MRFLNRTFARFKRLQKTDYVALLLVCLMTLIGSVACVSLDIGITNLFLKNQGLLSIGFDYLWIALLLIGVGHYALLLDRRKGYRSTLYMLVALLGLWGLLLCVKTDYQEILANLLFIYKYGFIFLVSHVVWSVNTRFIKLDLASLKLLGVLGSELTGCIIGGVLAMHLLHNPFVLLWGGFLATVVFVVALKLVSDVFPIPNETFVPVTGGVQKASERTLVDCILGLAFCYSTVRMLIDFCFYTTLSLHPDTIISTMSWIWISFGIIGVVFTGVIWILQSRFIYTHIWGGCLLCLSLLSVALGKFFALDDLVYGGVIGFMLAGRFYFDRYLRLLPCPLLLGKGMRIKTMRFLLIEPVGIIFAGALVMTIPKESVIWLVGGMSFLMFGLFVVSSHIYGRLLIQMCYLKRYCKGPLLLTYTPLKQMVFQGVTSQRSHEVIYFLTILCQSHHPLYEQYLLHNLRHADAKVRMFVLSSLDKLGLDADIAERIQQVFQTDECVDVQNHALACVIRYEASRHDKKTCEKYLPYLKNKSLRFGACLGLLATKNAWDDAYKMMTVWISSKDENKRMALKIMTMCPRLEWEPWIRECLFKSGGDIEKLALQAAGALAHPRLLAGIFNALDHLTLREYALSALSSYGIRALPSIEKVILNPSMPFERRKVLIAFLGRQPWGTAKQVLLRTLFVEDSRLRLVAIQTLFAAQVLWIHQNRRLILRKRMLQDIQRWCDLKDNLDILNQYTADSLESVMLLLRRAVQDEMNTVRSLIIYQIQLFHTHQLIQRSCQLLLGTDVGSYAGAVSCLQDLLPKDVYADTRSVLLNHRDQNPKHGEYQDVDVYLAGFILSPPAWCSPWMQVLALHGMYLMRSRYVMESVKKALQSSNWLVLDTALWILGRVCRNKKQVQDLTLSVPTRYLVQHQFQKLLEE